MPLPLVCSCHYQLRPSYAPKRRILGLILLLVLSLAIIEWGVSYFSHSLTLLVDSGHLLADSSAIALALLAVSLSKQSLKSAGKQQIEGLAALVNSIGVLLMVAWIAAEAIAHLQSPPAEILTLPMFLTGILGLGVNLTNMMLLKREPQTDLNVQGVFLHLLADTLSSLGAMLAAIAVAWQHWLWADGLISLCLAAFLSYLTFPLLINSVRLLRQPHRPDCLYSPEQLLFPSLEQAIKSSRTAK